MDIHEEPRCVCYQDGDEDDPCGDLDEGIDGDLSRSPGR